MSRACAGLDIRRIRPTIARLVLRLRLPLLLRRVLRLPDIPLLSAIKIPLPSTEEMPNTFTTSNTMTNVVATIKPRSGLAVVVVFVVLAVLVVVAYVWWPWKSRTACPKELHRHEDGHLSLKGTGKTFSDMNEFEQWWHSSGMNATCPLPLLTGARLERTILESGGGGGWPAEQTFARTPIYKVDDYEFSRVFGNERDGHMEIAKRDYNLILEDRQRDWTNLPVSAESRAVQYKGLMEGFAANGVMTPAREAAARYGEKAHAHEDGMDVECKLSREAKEVAAMVAKAYEDDPDYEPVITKVGANHWEVNELKPRHRKIAYSDAVDNRVVNTANEHVRKEFKYEQDRMNEAAIDPFFPPERDELPWMSDRMDRMVGPTRDRADWTVPTPGGLAWAGGPHPMMLPETPN